jgi:intein/homing endonuclease
MGDGSLTTKESSLKKYHHDIRFYPDHIILAELFSKDFEKLYLKKPYIKKEENYFIVHISSKPAWKDLFSIASFSSEKWELPEGYFKSLEEKIEWLRALYDCEGYVGKKVIQIQSVSKKGIESIKELLNQLGIRSSICIYKRKNPNHKINYILSITGRDRFLSFFKLVSFNHPNKKKKLLELCRCARTVIGTVSKTVPSRASRFNS